jgi:endonuclease/exonuclease/phosphatase family metal-dependent hydrolase
MPSFTKPELIDKYASKHILKMTFKYISRFFSSDLCPSILKINSFRVLYTVILLSFGIYPSLIGQSYRLMTYNIRFDNPGDKPHLWVHRLPLITDQILRNNIDIAGFQEALHHQVEDLYQALKSFDWVGLGRDDGKLGGEFSPLFYKRDKFDLMNHGTIWLSETPAVPSIGWDAALPRIATWAILKDKKTAKSILVFNTHFDHVGIIARQKSLLLLHEFAMQGRFNAYPLIIMGDFNLSDTDPVWSSIKEETPLQDAFNVAQVKKGPHGTFNAFNWRYEGARIDYILTESIFQIHHYEVIKSRSRKKILPSDHWPVWVELSFK